MEPVIPGAPVPGEILEIGRAASPQFGGNRGIVLRVIAVSDQPTYHGWAWITGYVLDRAGLATDRREVYVNLAGLRVLRRAETTTAPRRTPGTRIPSPRHPDRNPTR